MDIISNLMEIVVLFVSIIVLVSSFVTLYRWRPSAFDSTTAYLRNLRYIPPGEKVCIQAPDEPGMQYVCSGKSSKTAVYWEYCYTVDGIQYCKSYFNDDDSSELPHKIRIYYNREKPKIMYREGSMRDGVFVSVLLIVLSTLFLFLLICSNL